MYKLPTSTFFSSQSTRLTSVNKTIGLSARILWCSFILRSHIEPLLLGALPRSRTQFWWLQVICITANACRALLNLILGIEPSHFGCRRIIVVWHQDFTSMLSNLVPRLGIEPRLIGYQPIIQATILPRYKIHFILWGMVMSSPTTLFLLVFLKVWPRAE